MATASPGMKSSVTRTLGHSVKLVEHHTGDIYVSSPFEFSDGDVLPIFLHANGGGFCLVDQGKTLQHLSYDFASGMDAQWAAVERMASESGLVLDRGELSLRVAEQRDIGPAILRFAQGLTRIADVVLLRTEKAPSKEAFRESVRTVLRELFADVEQQVNYRDKDIDPAGVFPIPLRLVKRGQVFIFPLTNAQTCADAVATHLYFMSRRAEFRSFGIYQDIEKIPQRRIGQVMDVCDHNIASLDAGRDKLLRDVNFALAS